MKRPSLFAILGGVAVVVIVVASLVVRAQGPADPAADVTKQRAAVERFHQLVIDERWEDVFRATSEPPARSAGAFARLMRKQVDEHGTVEAVEVGGMRLLRSRSVPLLEVEETVTTSRDGERQTEAVVSYFALRREAGDERWLFAFSATR